MFDRHAGKVVHDQPVDHSLASWSDIEAEFRGGGLLIGNGFSQAVWKKFGYSSIYEAASSKEYTNCPLTSEDIRLFESMETHNFETVLSNLSRAGSIVSIFEKDCGYLIDRYNHIKNALGEAVRSVHVPWSHIKLAGGVLSKIRSELTKYKAIYSTNYDIIPYWAIMSEMSEENKYDFKDFFWSRDSRSPEKGKCCFDIADTDIYHNSTIILYLHGALHLYRDPYSNRTHKSINDDYRNLLDMDRVPLFITEGSSSDKLRAIYSSDYLLFAYNKFLNHVGSLVIFGHSLNESDQHLIDAIKKGVEAEKSRRIERSGISKIAISIRGSNTPHEIKKRKINISDSIYEDMQDWRKPEIVFFDAASHPLGSADIRVEDGEGYSEWLAS